jgi:hypothetical protein
LLKKQVLSAFSGKWSLWYENSFAADKKRLEIIFVMNYAFIFPGLTGA